VQKVAKWAHLRRRCFHRGDSGARRLAKRLIIVSSGRTK
jgi:hypothetical protein